MAKPEQLKASKSSRQNRYFSEEFKRKKVEELDKKLTTVAEVCREYEVSQPAVYKWLYKYSLMRKKGIKMVVEAESDTAKITALREHVAQLEQLLGQKQFKIDFLEKQFELVSAQYGLDLKKKLSGKPCSGFGNIGEGTATA